MKNKESKNNSSSMFHSKKIDSSRLDPNEAARLITSGRQKSTSASQVKVKQSGPTKSQIERLKKFYNTTRWLPNSAFTTFFGKPAFENYGYGNTKPTYGGLFYGNYMLSHNVNPMDGNNIPETKQVYSSAMLKAIKRNDLRKPSPPRKTPDEIRNTPDELDEIQGRNPIFQLPNQMPPREIVRPNLLKERYFRSGNNSPNDSQDEVDFDIEDLINGRHIKKKKISQAKTNKEFNPFSEGKNKAAKKKTKERLDTKIDTEELRQKMEKERKKQEKLEEEEKYIQYQENVRKNNNVTTKEDTNANKNEEEEYQMKKQFYEKMLNEEYEDNPKEEHKISRQNSNKIASNFKTNTNEKYNYQIENSNKFDNADKYDKNSNYLGEQDCVSCEHVSNMQNKSILRKKENPALMHPQGIRQTHVCCLHNSNERMPVQEKDPRNYMDKPPCLLEKISPAGKPMKRSEPVSNLFR